MNNQIKGDYMALIQASGLFDFTDKNGVRLCVAFKDIRTITIKNDNVCVNTIYENIDLDYNKDCISAMDQQLNNWALYTTIYTKVE